VRPRPRKLALLGLAPAAALILAAAGAYRVESLLIGADRHPDARPPRGMNAESVTIPSESGASLAAWVFEPPDPRAVVVVLHGIHADRSTMLRRARLLVGDGFAVVTPDLQAHGESTGDHITFGFLEARDAEASVAYARKRFGRLRVGGIGVSLGGAAFALAANRAPLDALVLEAAFPTLEEALDNRVAARIGPLSRLVTPLLIFRLKSRLGLRADQIRPIEAIEGLRCPVLILSGTADRDTTPEQTEALFAAAPEPKELWMVPGAAHVDLQRYDAPGYARHVLPFLEKALDHSAAPDGKEPAP